MAKDFEIGRVVGVDTAKVTIELNEDLRALTRSTYEGVQEVGRINGYVIMPVGAHRLVAMVTRVFITEEAEMRADRTMVTLPSARRLMVATLIGTIDGQSFTQGVSLFPVLDNPVLLPSNEDLDVIFGRPDGEPLLYKPGYCVRVGESALFKGRPIHIDPDAFFGKHAAVIGSTGSGKSCTIATLIQSIIEQPKVRRTNFVILDTNGEYRSAFQRQKENDDWEPIGKWKSLYIPSDPRTPEQRLVIPYWFLNADDFVRLFRAREGIQAPVLLRALRLARSGVAGASGILSIVETLRTACIQILSTTQNENPSQQWALAKNIEGLCADGLRYRLRFPQHVQTLSQRFGIELFDQWETAVRQVQQVAQQAQQRGNQGGLGGTCIQQIRDLIEPVIQQLSKAIAADEQGVPGLSADEPVFFDRPQFLESALDTAMREQAESGNIGRVRDACGPMLLRIRRFFEDPRFRFLFGSFPNAAHVLAAFLRDVLGLEAARNPTPSLSDLNAVPKGVLPFYDRQRAGIEGHHIVILDLSLLASEVLENITALIGRFILEFLRRLGEHGGEDTRGSLPVVLVLEEAQNYIRERGYGEEESISREVFERIAREGRKYGLGLVVSSQRPSEISKTVLSQCNSFVVHRLQNPEDLRYFKDIVPSIYSGLLDQLPALAPQTALILGECVRAPALVRIREAQPLPRSRDPKFYKHWAANETADVPVEEICARWEGREQRPPHTDAGISTGQRSVPSASGNGVEQRKETE
jgi:DNA helicase HerA-like ATPase